MLNKKTPCTCLGFLLRINILTAQLVHERQQWYMKYITIAFNHSEIFHLLCVRTYITINAHFTHERVSVGAIYSVSIERIKRWRIMVNRTKTRGKRP